MKYGLEIRTLGGLSVTCNGELVSFKQRKTAALLVYLACTGTPHVREVLAEMLWENRPQSQSFSNLRVVLTDLRHAVGAYLAITRETVALRKDSDWWLDAANFESRQRTVGHSLENLEETLDLYRGDFLEGFYVDSPAFEDWARLKREQLRFQVLDKLNTAINLNLSQDNIPAAMSHATHMLHIDSLDEVGHQQILRCLALSGQRSAARIQYDTYRRLLADELNMQPGVEITALYTSIRDGTYNGRPAESVIPPFLNSPAPIPKVESPLFVGCQTELRQLDGFLQRILAGNGRVAFVIGESGSGKTMLLQEFTRRALDTYPDLIVASGNCNAYTGIGDPYLPFLQMLDMLTGDVEARWSGGTITSEHARRLWSLLPQTVQALLDDGPELIDRLVSGPGLLERSEVGAPQQAVRLEELLKARAASPGGSDRQQSDLFEQYARALRTLAQDHPLLLVVDDLQWADLGSISLLFHLGRQLSGTRILLLGAYRPEEVAIGRNGERHPLEPVINEFQRDYGNMQVNLSQSEGRQWIDELLDSELNHLGTDFRETLYRHTGGHPLFTIELLRDLQERGDLIRDEGGCWVENNIPDWEMLPPRIEAVIAESVNRLPAILQTTLTIASIEGEFFTAQTVSHVQDVEAHDVIQHLSGPLSKQYRMVNAVGVERLDGRQLFRYRFRHFLFQKYLYNRLDEVERAHLHQAMGHAIEELHGEDVSELAAQLAWHFEAAGLTALAVKYLHQAGDRARELFANAEAVSLYSRALRLLDMLPDTPERAGQKLRLRMALRVPLEALHGYTSTEMAENSALVRELIQHAEASPELFWTLTGLSNFCIMRLSLHEAQQLCEEKLRLAERLHSPMLRLHAYSQLSIVALYTGQMGDFWEYRRHVQALEPDANPKRDQATTSGLDASVEGLSHEAWAYWLCGYPDQARQRCQAALDWAEELGHPFSLAFALFFASTVSRWSHDVPMIRTLAEQTMVIAQEQNMAFWRSTAVSSLGWVLVEEGQVDEGLTQLEREFKLKTAAGSQLARIMNIPMVGDALIRAGRAQEAQDLISEGLQVALETGFAMMVPDIYRCQGDMFLAIANEQEAEVCFQQAIKAVRRTEMKSWELRAALRLCRLWQRQGKDEAACELLAPLYDWFTEGFDTQDLQEARILLEQLSNQQVDRC